MEVSAYKGAKILETIENYGIVHNSKELPVPESEDYSTYFLDQKFWYDVLQNKNILRDKFFTLQQFVVSDWVARVPGLFWTESAQSLRKHNDSDVAFQSDKWTKFNPPGKSKKVLGGVGTLLLPPTDSGKVLMSISASCNASTGIPILIFPEISEELKIKQGDCVDIIDAKWQAMSTEWSGQFAFSKEVPRGYLVIDDIKKINVSSRNHPVEYHPFSIMEYEAGDALLYDFVYASADSKVYDVDRKLEKFFKDYGKEGGRNGNYLLNPNIVQPLFETQFSSPSELSHPSQKAKLSLIQQRIREVFFNDVNINHLINELPKHYQSSTAIRGLTTRIGLSAALLSEDSAASMSAQLISMCIQKDAVETLIDRMVWEYPTIFK